MRALFVIITFAIVSCASQIMGKYVGKDIREERDLDEQDKLYDIYLTLRWQYREKYGVSYDQRDDKSYGS